MHTPRTLLSLGGAIASLTIAFAGAASAAPAPAPPPAPPAPTSPTYICDNINALQSSAFGYTNCQAFGGMTNSGYIPNGQSYLLIPRTGNIQKYRCSGGAADMPTSIAPARCAQVGRSIPASEAPPPVPYGGPGSVTH